MSDTVVIKIPITSCNKCPFIEVKRTMGAGYALDWHCTAKENRLIKGYIEYLSEHPDIPEWCPHRENQDD